MHRALVALLAASLLVGFAGVASGQRQLTEDERKILTRLETYQLTMDFQEAPFEEVIEYLRLATNVNIVLDPAVTRERAPEEMRVTLKVRDLPAINALKLLLDINKLDYILENNVLLVTTTDVRQRKPYARLYDIRDLLFEVRDFPGPDISLNSGDGEGGVGAIFGDDSGGGDDLTQPDVIVDILRENTGVGTWDDGTTSIQSVSGLLVVRQSEEVHREVERMLNLLRAYK